MRLRRQKEVQKDNEYYYEFLREALPPGVREEAFNFNPQPSPKPCSSGDGDRISSENGGLVNNAPPGTPSAHPLAAGGGVMGGSGVEPLSSSLSNVDLLSSSACSTSLLNGDAASSISSASNGSLIAGLANGKHHNGDLNHSTASKLAAFGNGLMFNKNSVKPFCNAPPFFPGAPLSNGSLNNNAGGELDYMEKMRGDEPDEEKSSKRSGVKSVPRDTSRKGRTSAMASNPSGGPNRDELLGKFEADIKKLKVDLQLSRNKENDLRDQIVSYMTGTYCADVQFYRNRSIL